ncbi:MAG: type II toxin-antitoxin system VapC family toxin [bacterium]|jgi:predicted nucleic acid-binding protein
MIIAVDTNFILDVVTDDPTFADQSQTLLGQAFDSGALVICEIVYAELAPQFDTMPDLDSVLDTLNIRIVEGGKEVAYLAGRKWVEYKQAGGTRQRLLPDFLVGSHALQKAECLLTRDRGFYKTYFPELKLFGGR